MSSDRETATGQAPRPFQAVLHPHRSLSRQGFIALMAAVALVSFAAGAVFVAAGAWPVLGFFGLDALLIYGAFRLNYRAGRLRETVQIDDGRMVVRRIHPSGRTESWEFQPYWARVELKGDTETGNELAIVSHGRRLVFGRFLNPDERAEFADVLTSALAAHKAG